MIQNSSSTINPYLQKAALLLLVSVIAGSAMVVGMESFNPNATHIDLIVPPLNFVLNCCLLAYLLKNPRQQVQVFWISLLFLLASFGFSSWFFLIQASIDPSRKLIDVFPPLTSILFVAISTMFVFTKPKQVFMTASSSWILINLPVLVYLLLHQEELFTPYGMQIFIALGPSMLFMLIVIELHKGLNQNIALLAQERSQLKQLAERDPLTQLYNRRGFLELISGELEKQELEKKQPLFGVILFDLDHFKRINDTYGHEVGDRVLSQVAQRCRAVLRQDDLFVRWGGEEFVIVIKDAGDEALYRIANSLRGVISSQPIQPIPQVTASFGITKYRDSESIHTVIQRADEAMYQAKQHGRNQVFQR